MATGSQFEQPYTAEERLYLDADGKVIKGGDSPRTPEGAVTLLAPKGGTLPAARARELGLVSGDPAEAVPLRSEPAAGIAPAPAGSVARDVPAAQTRAEAVPPKGDDGGKGAGRK